MQQSSYQNTVLSKNIFIKRQFVFINKVSRSMYFFYYNKCLKRKVILYLDFFGWAMST